jgi:hypothetical protein
MGRAGKFLCPGIYRLSVFFRVSKVGNEYIWFLAFETTGKIKVVLLGKLLAGRA